MGKRYTYDTSYEKNTDEPKIVVVGKVNNPSKHKLDASTTVVDDSSNQLYDPLLGRHSTLILIRGNCGRTS